MVDDAQMLEAIKAALQVYPWRYEAAARKGSVEMQEIRRVMRRAGRELGMQVRTTVSNRTRSDGNHVVAVMPADIDERGAELNERSQGAETLAATDAVARLLGTALAGD